MAPIIDYPPFKKTESLLILKLKELGEFKNRSNIFTGQGHQTLCKVMICNLPLNPEESVRADHIYGPARLLPQGGMKRRRKPSKKYTHIYPANIHINTLQEC